MDVNYKYRDIAYTIFSRFEEAMRNFVANKLCVLYPDYKLGIPEDIINQAKNSHLALKPYKKLIFHI